MMGGSNLTISYSLYKKGGLMELHPREKIARDAEKDFNTFILEFYEKHDLTYAEIMSIFNKQIATCLKYSIRVERHGDENKPGGLI